MLPPLSMLCAKAEGGLSRHLAKPFVHSSSRAINANVAHTLKVCAGDSQVVWQSRAAETQCCDKLTYGGWTLSAFGGSVFPKGVDLPCARPLVQPALGGAYTEAPCPRQGIQFLRVVTEQL